MLRFRTNGVNVDVVHGILSEQVDYRVAKRKNLFESMSIIIISTLISTEYE